MYAEVELRKKVVLIMSEDEAANLECYMGYRLNEEKMPGVPHHPAGIITRVHDALKETRLKGANNEGIQCTNNPHPSGLK